MTNAVVRALRDVTAQMRAGRETFLYCGKCGKVITTDELDTHPEMWRDPTGRSLSYPGWTHLVLGHGLVRILDVGDGRRVDETEKAWYVCGQMHSLADGRLYREG